jgi:fido (protein-threonine AMPylation protein)
LLRLDNFEDVDPQHPRGGPDGGKDILCAKDGNTFVAAVHFARTKNKFKSDLSASLKHNCSGFIFLTNQELNAGERSQLEKLAAAAGKRCLIYHRERLRVMLDSPQGYGLRLGHLGLAMSMEEQAAFFASSGQNLTEALKAQTRAIEELSRRVIQVARENIDFVAHSAAVVMDAVRDPNQGRTDLAAMLEAAAATALNRIADNAEDGVSARLTPPLLRYVHRLIMPTDPAFAGKFRETQVWLVNSLGEPNSTTECPAWDKVPTLVDELLEQWNRDFAEFLGKPQTAIPVVARFFQQLVWIHPFIDGNGRLARAILALQARELFGLDEDPILDRGAPYYIALKKADAGEFGALEKLIEDAIGHAR